MWLRGGGAAGQQQGTEGEDQSKGFHGDSGQFKGEPGDFVIPWAHSEARELAEREHTTLRLVCSASLAPYLVSRSVAKLYERFPRLRCRVQMVASGVINQHLLDRASHLGIALAPHDNPNLINRAVGGGEGFVAVIDAE